MAKGPQLTIAGRMFPWKAAALRECTRILNDGPAGTIVEGADSEFVEVLWLNRPDKQAEFPGKKVVRFERRYRAGKEKWTICFWAVFEDGTATDFSYKKAIENIEASHRLAVAT
ncbi:DUF3223 domain-containing protein [Devosia albogilva]|uniref:DUF3223 domain-containing protein n=1 Tax=Devosia albogilva TaxID=429726 RepID=A0ABW5QKI1_9HYPH